MPESYDNEFKQTAVKLYLNDNYSMNDVCDITGCKKTSLKRWIDKYEKGLIKTNKGSVDGFKCQRCHKIFSKKINLQQHIERKNPCELVKKKLLIQEAPIELTSNNTIKKDFQCQFCHKYYSTNGNLQRHLHDFCKFNQNNKINVQNASTINNQNAPTFNINNNLDNSTTNNIVVLNFGHENLNYINEKYLHSLLKKPYLSVNEIIKNLHFHPKHPENHNVFIKNRKNGGIYVMKNGKWILTQKKPVIEHMVEKGYNIIEYHYDKCDHEEKKKYPYFKNFMKSYENNLNGTKRKIIKESEFMVITNQQNMKNKPKF